MSDAPLLLQVRVPPGGDGYVWRPGKWDEDGSTEKGPVLIERQDRVFDDYFPADEPIAFYRELADVEPSEAGILRFANRYGTLWGHDAKWVAVADIPGRDTPAAGYDFVQGEPLEDWVRVIEEAHEAVALWDMARAGDREGLSEALEWRADGADGEWRGEDRVYYLGTARYRTWRDAAPLAILAKLDEPRERHRIWSESSERRLLLDSQGLNKSHVRKGDLSGPAYLRVMQIINAFVYAPNGPVLYWDERRGRPGRQDLSANLGGFLWLQFAQAVELQKEPRRCRECGRWFEVSKGASRTDRLTCSSTCRTRAYRERQAQAATMWAEGKTVKRIAKELGSDEDTVQKWIKASKKKEK